MQAFRKFSLRIYIGIDAYGSNQISKSFCNLSCGAYSALTSVQQFPYVRIFTLTVGNERLKRSSSYNSPWSIKGSR